MAFRVGQKVVCVNAGKIHDVESSDLGWAPGEEIHEGRIYTISKIFIDPAGEDVFELVEVRRTKQSIAWGHVGYNVRRFRPIVEKKTDIGFAHEILRKVTRKQTVRA